MDQMIKAVKEGNTKILQDILDHNPNIDVNVIRDKTQVVMYVNNILNSNGLIHRD